MSQAFEIRPHRATGIRGVDLPRIGANDVSQHWCLSVDPDAGTASWQWRADKSLLMRLPGRGPEQLPELARLVIADSFDVNEARVGNRRWLVLVDARGRALCTAATMVTPIFQQLFHDDAFQPLAPYGVEVVHERYRRSRDMNRRYPGSEPLVRKLIVDHFALTSLGGALVLFLLFLLVLVVFD